MLKPGRLAVAAMVVALGAGACARARPRTAPALPPLASTVLTADAAGWPPALEPAPVSAWLAEFEAEAAEITTPVERLESPARPEPRERRTEPPGAGRPPEVERLGTPETADTAAATRRVLETVARARAALAAVRVERLKGDARVQYQTAQQLIAQAEAAVRVANFMYALRLADKAEALARGLAGG